MIYDDQKVSYFLVVRLLLCFVPSVQLGIAFDGCLFVSIDYHHHHIIIIIAVAVIIIIFGCCVIVNDCVTIVPFDFSFMHLFVPLHDGHLL